MIVKIDKTHKDLLARVCAENLTSCRFFTVETNDEILKAEIDCNNLAIVFSLGKQLGMHIIYEAWERTNIKF